MESGFLDERVGFSVSMYFSSRFLFEFQRDCDETATRRRVRLYSTNLDVAKESPPSQIHKS